MLTNDTKEAQNHQTSVYLKVLKLVGWHFWLVVYKQATPQHLAIIYIGNNT